MALASENAKASLCRELKLALKNAALEIPLGDSISSEATLTLCNVTEAIFIHGLKDPFFLKGSRYAKYPEPNFWPFLYKYTHKSIKNQIDGLNQIKTEIGKARAWIRIVLNENSMEHYLRLFARDPQGFRAFYHKYAFLRDFESFNVMTGYMKGIANISVNAPVNSSFLNTWTPSPLILAGLVPGKPTRLEQRSSRHYRDIAGEGELEEVGEFAVDLIDLQEADQSSKKKLLPEELHNIDDDEISSVYSHPSMIESGPGDSSALFFFSTPEKEDFLSEVVPEISGFTTESYQVNVRRRKHRLRRVSKSSSEEGFHSGNGSSSNLLSVEKQKASKADKHLSFHNHDEVLLLYSSYPVTNMKQVSSVVDGAFSRSSGSGEYEIKEEFKADLDKHTRISEPVDFRKESDEPCFCEDSCDSGVAEVSPPENECPASERSAVSHCDKESKIPERTDSHVSDQHLDSTLHSSGDDRNDSVLSLQEELSVVVSEPAGNSLFGKEWAFCSLQPSQKDWEQTSRQSSSLRTNSSHNFDSMMRNVVSGYENNELETSVRSRLDSENFSETFNGEASSFIEIGTASMHESADEGSFIATATFQKLGDKILQKEGMEQNAVVVEEEEMNGQDEYGISRELIPLLTEIPRETGLIEQNFRCASCNKSIGPTFSAYRVCGFDGKYYCTNCCRKSDQSLIPSRLIHSWDSRPRSISRTNLAFLRAIDDRPIIRLDKVNPSIYEHCPVMKRILSLRGKLALAAMYLLSCRQSVAEDLRLRLWPKEYLYNDLHLYSFSDFQSALSGQLEGHLNSIIRYAVTHIFNCKLCVQKGFFCEICSSREVIYPFQVETTIRCTACFSVYHKRCFGNDCCRKCARREHYSKRVSSLGDHLLLD